VFSKCSKLGGNKSPGMHSLGCTRSGVVASRGLAASPGCTGWVESLEMLQSTHDKSIAHKGMLEHGTEQERGENVSGGIWRWERQVLRSRLTRAAWTAGVIRRQSEKQSGF
jgi:hypothetical protein